ncbi:MAG: FKBP-type peptidyl-prolyl cis-trans isomerase [Lachnospiraceae bacterium]|nr:FKBP-type peptidyl-prolyl cis-trans isomerase [Lachnospiraceae bacterium]MBQ8328272.1 FKBP-type peptidyl-prolyl cis-trans isomerase [Lachnospiraceae bacterium]
MAGNKNTKYDGMSASKAKRERARDEREQAKRSASRNKAIGIGIIVVIAALIGAAFGRSWYAEKNKTVASTDYSAMLNEDGTIKDVNVTDYVKTFDVNAVKLAKADVEYTDEKMQEDINKQLESHRVLNADTALAVKDGDVVNIDYTGTIDGTEFDGGSAQDYDLTIGSGSFIDNFEQQLIGTHPGDQLTVNVTFPEEYPNNPDLAGKAAAFAVTVNGIKELPEFTDEFVKANLSENAQTVEEYKQYLKDTNYKSNLASAVSKYISDNISADNYPTAYLKQLKALQMTLNEEEFNYMAQMYAQYGMNFSYGSVMEYKGAANTAEYEKVLEEDAKKFCLNNMAYQELAAQAGITVSDEDYEAFKTENGVTEEIEETYGKPYLIQQYILPEKVETYIAEHAAVE